MVAVVHQRLETTTARQCRSDSSASFFAVLGWLVLLWCARDFAVRGRGTPNPADPPRALVVDGLYRFVRNPMYVAIVTSLLGQAAMYRSSSVVWYAAIVAAAFHLRVVLYEEPKLTELFGDSYADYRRRVPRWVPRVALRGPAAVTLRRCPTSGPTPRRAHPR